MIQIPPFHLKLPPLASKVTPKKLKRRCEDGLATPRKGERTHRAREGPSRAPFGQTLLAQTSIDTNAGYDAVH